MPQTQNRSGAASCHGASLIRGRRKTGGDDCVENWVEEREERRVGKGRKKRKRRKKEERISGVLYHCVLGDYFLPALDCRWCTGWCAVLQSLYASVGAHFHCRMLFSATPAPSSSHPLFSPSSLYLLSSTPLPPPLPPHNHNTSKQ